MAQAHVRGAIDPPCPRHPKSEAVFVCLENECEEALACPECIVGDGDHNKHEITLLKNHLDTFKKKITDFKKNTGEQILAPLKEKVDKVANELEAMDPATSAILEEIDARGKQINDQTNTLVTELKAKCSQIGASNRQMMEQYQRRLLGKITEIEADITALDNFLSADCKADIVNGAKPALSKKYQDLPYPDNIKEVSFKGSETPLNNVATLLGIIVIGTEQPVRAETDTEKIKRLENSIKDMEKTGKDYQAHIKKLREELQNARKEKTADAHEKRKMQDSIDELRAELEQSRSAMQQLTDTYTCQSCHEPKSSCACRTCSKCQYKGNDFKVSIVFHIICLGNYYIIRICIQFDKHTTDR
ncbi:myosin heavy chain, clone 203-like [Pecten maximus]|uniref:myosin heavy chain, clone 203-like n=1 Tax=Pecten maximus TaxID=6579 RepID=UPI001459045A|nr:myosin heavy chain, clone 203-like [Pecten maximus]